METEKHDVLKKYEEWKMQNPEEDDQYDLINEFFNDLSRGELLSFMEWILNN